MNQTENHPQTEAAKEIQSLRYIVEVVRNALNAGATLTRTDSTKPVFQRQPDSTTIEGNVTFDYQNAPKTTQTVGSTILNEVDFMPDRTPPLPVFVRATHLEQAPDISK